MNLNMNMNAIKMARRFLAGTVLSLAIVPTAAPAQTGGGPGNEVNLSDLFRDNNSNPPAPQVATSPIRWGTDLVKTFEEGVRRQVPVVLFVANNSCKECNGRCRTTQAVEASFADPRVSSAAERAVFVRVDGSRLSDGDLNVLRALKIEKIPTVAIFYTKPGSFKEVGRINEGFQADTFAPRFNELFALSLTGREASPVAPPPAPPVPAPAPVPTPTTTAPSGVLTPQTLPTFLTSMGYDVKTVKGEGTSVFCVLTLNNGTRTFPVIAFLNPSGDTVWLLTSVGRMSGDTNLSAGALTRLLAVNDEIGPLHFSIDPKQQLILNYPFPNSRITPESFRGRVDFLCNQALKNEATWKVLTSTPPNAPAQPTPVASPRPTAPAFRRTAA